MLRPANIDVGYYCVVGTAAELVERLNPVNIEEEVVAVGGLVSVCCSSRVVFG